MSGSVATLGLQIDGNNVLKATGALKEFTAASKDAEAAIGRAGKSAQSATQQMAEKARLVERAEREWQQKQQASARRQIAEAAENGRKQAVALMGALDRQFKLDMARVREGQARGFLTETEARAAGREAATAYNQGVVQALDRGGGAVGLGQQQFTRMAGSLKNIDTESRRAGLGVGQLRETMGSLAARAAGTHPVVGQLAGVLGSFAIGSTLMVGILGGLAAIALAWNKITEKSREAKDEQESAQAFLQGIGNNARNGATGEIDSALRVQNRALGPLEAQRTTKIAQLNAMMGSLSSDPAMEQIDAGVRARLTRQITDLTNQIQTIRQTVLDGETERTRIQKEGLEDRARAIESAAEKELTRQRELAAARLQVEQQLASDVAALWDRLSQGRTNGNFTFTPSSVPRLGNVLANDAHMTSRWDEEQALRASGRMNLDPVANAMRPGVRTPPGAGGLKGAAGDFFGGLKDQAMGLATSFGPLAAAAAVLKPVFEGLMEVVGPVLSALAEPLRTIGQLLGASIAPALKVLQPLLDAVAKAFSYVISAVGWLIRAIGKAINFISPGNPGNGLVKWGQSMMDQAEAARKATTAVDELATAAGRASANIPNIVSIEAWRQRAMGGSGTSGSTSSPVGTVGGGSVGGSSGGTNGAGGNRNGDTYYVIQGDVRSDAPDAKRFFEDIRRIAVRDVRTGGVGFREAV